MNSGRFYLRQLLVLLLLTLTTDIWASDFEYGFQTYSIRHLKGQKLQSALFKLNAVGYKFVEIGENELDFNFEHYGFKVNSVHLNPQWVHRQKEDKQLNQLLVKIKNKGILKVGIAFLAPPNLPKNNSENIFDTIYRLSEKDIKNFATRLEEMSIMAKKHGLKLFYHPHSFEFVEKSFGNIFNIIKKRNINIQVDLFWFYYGNKTLQGLIKEISPDRIVSYHFKQPVLDNHGKVVPTKNMFLFENFAPLRKSSLIDWSKVLDLIETKNMSRDIFVEIDMSLQPVNDLVESIKYLSSLKKPSKGL